MAATDMYLCRKNGNPRYIKYSGVIAIDVTGAQQVYSSVTGDAATDTLTIVNHTLQNGYAVFFQSIDGGAGLSINTTYWVISASGNTLKLSLTPGGSAVNFTTDITSGVLICSNNEIFVWSAAFRDIFSTNLTSPSVVWNGPAFATLLNSSQSTGGVSTPSELIITPTYGDKSDEVAHIQLRQSALRKSFWRFNLGADATPPYGYAEILDGDVIANNAPQST